MSSRIYNDNYAKVLNISDASTYRDFLQSKSNVIRSTEISKYEQSRCTNNKNNTFYIDSSKYTFDKPLTDAYLGQKIQNDGTLKKSTKSNF